MIIDPNDVDYNQIDRLFSRLEEKREEWIRLERIYRTIKDKALCDKAKKFKRTYELTPIARDTVHIKRATFSTSFLINDFALSIRPHGDEDDETARQLRIMAKYYWERSDAFIELNKAFLRMLICPVGITTNYWDPKKKKNIIEEVNPMDIAFDDEAKNHNDVQVLAYRYRKSAKDILKIIRADAKKPKKQRFYNHLKNFEEFFKVSYDPKTFEPFKRYELKEIYIKEDGYWLCKTYYENIMLRVARFYDCPFQWGFTREDISSVDPEVRENQQMVYGRSEIEWIEHHVNAMNKRRNQHSDIVEMQINPPLYVNKRAQVNPANLKKGPGSVIPVGDVSGIVEKRPPSTMSLHDDLAMLERDIETSSGIGKNQKNVTSTSDRRGLGALALLNSQSSIRLEEEIVTANNTLMVHLAKSFVKKVWRYADVDLMRAMGIDDPLFGEGITDADREFDYEVAVNFGSDTKRQEHYAAIIESLQMLGQFQDVNTQKVEDLAEKALRIKLGDDEDVESIFGGAQQQGEPLPPPTMGGGI